MEKFPTYFVLEYNIYKYIEHIDSVYDVLKCLR